MKIKTTANVAIAVIVAFATIGFDPSFARGGGGMRGGGGGGMRGGGGASFGGGGGARGGGIRSSGPTSIGQSSVSRGSFANNSSGGTRLADAGNRSSQISGSRGNFSGNNNRINTGDVNINNGSGNGWGGWVDHPVAAGVVTGAVVGATAAAVGSTYYDVPAGCPPYSSGGYTYYSCGGAYYQPQYQGDTVVYTTVPQP